MAKKNLILISIIVLKGPFHQPKIQMLVEDNGLQQILEVPYWLHSEIYTLINSDCFVMIPHEDSTKYNPRTKTKQCSLTIELTLTSIFSRSF
jgi:hypothetical protein